jgi:4-amino-4-deoxy-L-arabinose transferase-like glycosyltransferase
MTFSFIDLTLTQILIYFGSFLIVYWFFKEDGNKRVPKTREDRLFVAVVSLMPFTNTVVAIIAILTVLWLLVEKLKRSIEAKKLKVNKADAV